jgi:hypothetical protein
MKRGVSRVRGAAGARGGDKAVLEAHLLGLANAVRCLLAEAHLGIQAGTIKKKALPSLRRVEEWAV